MTQRNSFARKIMLEERALGQRTRFPALRFQGVPAFLNRHTGLPHENLRARARRLAQVAA